MDVAGIYMERIPIRTDEELAALTMPVQVILGGKDALLRSMETRTRMERLVSNIRVIYLENEGHILQPQTRVITEFLGTAAIPSRKTAFVAATCGEVQLAFLQEP
jgi:pimeloyl-ACP methyl ester carboxylesterase